MAQTVLYAPKQLRLNLTKADLGHPQLPGLWDTLRAEEHPRGTFVCTGCEPGMGGCIVTDDGAMFLRMHNRTRQAVHYPAFVDRHNMTAAESDLHKALKEYIADSAQHAGFHADVEQTASNYRRRPDVTVHGARRLHVEVQVSNIAVSTVTRRDQDDRQANATPLWVSRELAGGRWPEWLDRSPWTLLRNLDWRDVVERVDMGVRGGVRRLVFERCGYAGKLCPDRDARRGRTGAPCGRDHAYFQPVHNHTLGHVVQQMAAGELVDIEIPRKQRTSFYYIVAAEDARTWHSYRTADPSGALVDPDNPAGPERFEEASPLLGCYPDPDIDTRAVPPGLLATTDVWGGITRPVIQPADCTTAGCTTPGDLHRCMLCPHSPTYWKLVPAGT